MKKHNQTKIQKFLIVILIVLLLLVAIYTPLKFSGLLEKISSIDDLKQIILQSGIYGYIIFFVIQFCQVVLLPIPAAVTTIAGTLVFGPLIAALISLVAILLASIFAFFLGKKLGRKIIVWIAGEEETKKWEQKLLQGKYVFFLMMLFPVFPDDILCLIVGTTAMSYTFFIVTNLITRPIGIFTTCYLGSGQLIPFSGWGIPVWIALVIVGIVLFYLSFKFQPQIENFIVKLSKKLSKTEKKQENNDILLKNDNFNNNNN